MVACAARECVSGFVYGDKLWSMFISFQIGQIKYIFLQASPVTAWLQLTSPRYYRD